MSSRTGPTTYDRVPYVGKPVAGADCRRLETIATLFNLSPAPPCSARVLELGCGTGNNLLSQAIEDDGVHFTGCDVTQSAIAAAVQQAKTLGLANVEFAHADLCDVDSSWGQFDYIMCHGVFSWVGPEVRQRILEIVRNNLTPHGVGYVSYNTLPGWHLWRVAREAMCYHSASFDEPEQAIAQARAMLALMAEAQTDDLVYATLIRDEYFRLSQTTNSYLCHEMLEEHNQAFYFREFVDQAERAGLQFLGEAEMPRMFTWDLPPSARQFLEDMPLLVREQYLDLLRGSTFRKSLLCHRELAIDRRVSHGALNRFSVSLSDHARLEPYPAGDERSKKMHRLEGNERRLVIGPCELPYHNLGVAAALRFLGQRWPAFVTVEKLQEVASESVCPGASDSEATDCLLRFLWDAVTAGALELSLSPPGAASHISEYLSSHESEAKVVTA